MANYEVGIQAETRPMATLGRSHTTSFLKRHPVLFPTIVLIAVGSPFLGLMLSGWTGVAVGEIVNLGALFLGFRAVQSITRTIQHPPA